MSKKAKSESTTQYTLQFRFKPRGQWHTDLAIFYDFKEVCEELENCIQRSKDLEELGFAKYWRIVKREVTDWKEVK